MTNLDALVNAPAVTATFLNERRDRSVQFIVRMRMNLLLAGVCGGCLTGTGFTQNVMVFGAPGPGASAAQPAVQVVVQAAPIVYQAPMVVYSPPTPNVIYVGGCRGYPQPNFYSGGCYSPAYGGWYPTSPSVIYFGAGQGYAHGYRFRHCR